MAPYSSMTFGHQHDLKWLGTQEFSQFLVVTEAIEVETQTLAYVGLWAQTRSSGATLTGQHHDPTWRQRTLRLIWPPQQLALWQQCSPKCLQIPQWQRLIHAPLAASVPHSKTWLLTVAQARSTFWTADANRPFISACYRPYLFRLLFLSSPSTSIIQLLFLRLWEHYGKGTTMTKNL